MLFIYYLSCFFYSYCSFAFTHSLSPPLLGVHPLDEKYYLSEVIKCKDGSKSFTRDRLNDDFCDCFDGTDEPGTSACPRAKFYCRNVGSIPQFIFSSHVNDRVCDCCDGSDEYHGEINCPNTCVMGGHIEYRTENYVPKTEVVSSNNVKEIKKGGHFDDMIQNIKGLKIAIILQFVIIKVVVSLCILRCCRRSKKRRLPLKQPNMRSPRAFGFQFKQW